MSGKKKRKQPPSRLSVETAIAGGKGSRADIPFRDRLIRAYRWLALVEHMRDDVPFGHVWKMLSLFNDYDEIEHAVRAYIEQLRASTDITRLDSPMRRSHPAERCATR